MVICCLFNSLSWWLSPGNVVGCVYAGIRLVVVLWAMNSVAQHYALVANFYSHYKLHTNALNYQVQQ